MKSPIPDNATDRPVSDSPMMFDMLTSPPPLRGKFGGA